MNVAERFETYRDELAEFCRRNRIRKLSVFGSALRDDFTAESDVDVLVEFEPGQVPGLSFFAMADDLSVLFGRPVDFLTERGLNQHIRERVLREAHPLYDAALNPSTNDRLRIKGGRAWPRKNAVGPRYR